MNKKCLSLIGILVFLAGCSPVQETFLPAAIPSATATVETIPMELTKSAQEWTDLPVELVYTLTGSTAPAVPIVFSPNGDLIATGSDGNQILLWDSRDGSLIKTLPGHQSGVSALAFSPDGTQLASGGGDKTVRLWNVGSGEQTAVFEGHLSSISTVAFSPDGKTLASGSHNFCENNTCYSNGGQVRIWSVETGYISAWQVGEVAILHFNPDSSHLTAFVRSKIYYFDAPFKQEPRITGSDFGPDIYVSAYLPDKNLYVTGGMDIEFWNADTQELVKTIKGKNNAYIWKCGRVAFSPDESMVAGICSDGILRLWDVSNSKPLGKLPGNESIYYVAFSPESKMIATASGTHEVFVWLLK
jgi:WD40 repeat protein